jgi:hypothetical protein
MMKPSSDNKARLAPRVNASPKPRGSPPGLLAYLVLGTDDDVADALPSVGPYHLWEGTS